MRIPCSPVLGIGIDTASGQCSYFGMDITLEPLGENDIEFRWHVFEATIKPFVVRHSGLAEGELRSMLAGQLRGGRHRAIVVAGRRVGVLLSTNEGDHLAVHQLGILPGFQGRGIGTCVLKRLISQSQREHLPLRLSVFNDNHGALRLYKRLGFIVDSVDAENCHMRLDPVSGDPD